MSLPFTNLACVDILLVVIVRCETEMMRHPIGLIHGHTTEQLQHLLYNSCPLIGADVVLDSTIIGGWSNINIRGVSHECEFVIKLPWSIRQFADNPYSRLHNLLTFLHKSAITTSPLAVGRLNDKNETPFMLLKYSRGKARSSISDFSADELLSLKDTLHRLSLQRPPGLRQYKTPLDYLMELHDRIAYHETLSVSRPKVPNLLSAFSKQYARLCPRVETLDEWSGTTMHGDLWEPNILLQERRAILLDMESCSYGDPIFDLAYLLEASDNLPLKEPPLLLYGDTIERVNPLRDVALMSVISWSLDRLLFMDAGFAEPCFNSTAIRADIIGYVRTKLSRLVST